MTKISMLLKTSIFLFLLSMTQNLYAGCCQSVVSEAEPIESACIPKTSLQKVRLKEQGKRFSDAVTTFKNDITKAGLVVTDLQKIVLNYLIPSDDFEKITSGVFSIYNMGTEGLIALSQVNFAFFKENYKVKKEWSYYCFYQIDFRPYTLSGYNFSFSRLCESEFDGDLTDTNFTKARLNDVFFANNTYLTYAKMKGSHLYQVSMTNETYNKQDHSAIRDATIIIRDDFTPSDESDMSEIDFYDFDEKE
jgi:uncharacterized protein YjbI with pentapeptide repeats